MTRELTAIFQRLNHGIPIEYLSLAEREYLLKFYGEDWKTTVRRLVRRNLGRIR